MAADSARGNVVLFGGFNGASMADTWVTVAPVANTICLLYDPTKAVKGGSTIPIKLQLCDGEGANLSSSSIVLHAVGISLESMSISGDVVDAGNANADDDFRYDASLGGTGGYIFNLKTTGLTTGAYDLHFTVGTAPTVFRTRFQVK